MRYTEAEKEAKISKVLEILSGTSSGIHSACKEANLSFNMFYRWMAEDQELAQRYARARDMQADLLADQIVEIADDSSRDTKTVITKGGEEIEVENTEWVNRSKLRVEARKWIAAKLKPKKYGDKLDVTSDGKELKTAPIVIDWGTNDRSDKDNSNT